ncbi:MAG: hypothetical protein LBV80_05885 [Deltaproteobacteria bacterium]|jgi:tetratricopeptide (TPR) repeat protein|nr:hypothetical protein [Deltaproteobacteria bacterium]
MKNTMPLFRHAVLVLFLTITLLPPLWSFSASAAVAASLSSGKADAASLMQSGDHAGAFALYLNLLRETPDDFEVNLALARSAKLAGKYNHSRMAYERLIETLPENAILRLELAHLLLTMGQNEAAKAELAEAKRLDPSIAEGDMGKALASMEQRVDSFRVKGRLAGGMIYDSNMTTGPAGRDVMVGRLPIYLDRESSERESMGSYLHGVIDMGWRASADSPWWLVGDVAGYQRWYNETTPRRDMTFGRAAVGLRYLENSLMAEVRLKTELLLENEEKSVALYGSEASLVFAARDNLHLIGQGGIEHREDIAVRDRSGTYAWGGPYARWFFGEAKHSLMAGVKGYMSATDERRYSFSGIEPGVFLFLNLPWETELILSGAWHNEDYKGGATILDDAKRKDTQWRASAMVIKQIAESVQLEMGWQYTNNNSSSDLYTYDQHLLTLGLAFTF